MKNNKMNNDLNQIIKKYNKFTIRIVNKLNLDATKCDIRELRKDLYQEAAIAIILALKSFNASLNIKESTWVYNCIKWHLLDLYKTFLRNFKDDVVEEHIEDVDLTCIEGFVTDGDYEEEYFKTQCIEKLKKALSAEDFMLLLGRFSGDKDDGVWEQLSQEAKISKSKYYVKTKKLIKEANILIGTI